MNHRIKLIGKALPISEFGDPYLWFESLSGHEAINELYQYELIVHTKHSDGSPAHSIEGQQGYVSKAMTEAGDSPASHLNLQKLIGTTLGIDIELSDKKLDLLDKLLPEIDISGSHSKHGLIQSIKQLTTHNLHSVYQLTLVPWLWLLTQSNNYRIYQNQTIPHIIDNVLSHYPYPVEYRLSNSYPVLDYQTQYNESDYAFIARLMREHGINFHFEHRNDRHTLILTDQNSHYPVQDNPAYQDLLIYPPNQRMPNYAEYIEHFHPAQSLVTGQTLLADYQFKTPQLILTAHDQYQWDYKHNDLQHYEWQQGMGIDNEALQTKAEHKTQAHYQHGHRAYGQGRLKAIQVGHTFTLKNHPNTDSNIEWIVIGIQTTIQNLDPDNRTHQYYTADTQFISQSKALPLRPEPNPPKPIARVQTATVVAPSGEEIHTDEHGRIKVKFHWDKPSYADRQLFETLDAKALNTCWLRVSTAWAGENYGAIQLPRAGQEVIVDFFGGDPDMPFISGRLSNPDNMPLWQLPNEKVLSGLKSKEYQGQQSNQLVMDDTTGKLQVQLKSDHQSSELNLGSITRITPVQGRSDFRGEGFELRTDGHGVVRAAKGLILSTFARFNASNHVKSMQEAIIQLDLAVEQQKNTLASAIKHKLIDSLDQTVEPKLQAEYKTVKGESNIQSSQRSYPELSNNHLVLLSEQDTVLSSGQTTHIIADEIALTAKSDTTLSTTKRLIGIAAQGIRLFSQSEGVKLFSGAGKLELQSQSDDTELTSAKNTKIQAHDTIEITAGKELIINVDGSYIRISGKGIEQGTPGKWEAYATNHDLLGPKNLAMSMNEMPTSDYDQELYLMLPNGEPAKNVNFEIHHADGSVIGGVTDSSGNTKVQKTKGMGHYVVKVLGVVK